ncbi:MAG: hypothetical protein PHQ75_09410 [Thermoguttaceae bacterium]|nr:hypothetical protein [Thermoguttaceae bacterium]
MGRAGIEPATPGFSVLSLILFVVKIHCKTELIAFASHVYYRPKSIFVTAKHGIFFEKHGRAWYAKERKPVVDKILQPARKEFSSH